MKHLGFYFSILSPINEKPFGMEVYKEYGGYIVYRGYRNDKAFSILDLGNDCYYQMVRTGDLEFLDQDLDVLIRDIRSGIVL